MNENTPFPLGKFLEAWKRAVSTLTKKEFGEEVVSVKLVDPKKDVA